MESSAAQSPAAVCLVVLTDALYLPGTRKLLESWDAWHPRLPVVALSVEAAVLEDPWLVARCERRVRIDPAPYADIQTYKKRHSRRHAQTFFKFEAFGDFGFERNVFLDSDVLCLREASALLAPGAVSLRAVLDSGFRKTRAYKGHAIEINSGVLSIGSRIQGAATIARLQALARTSPGRGGYNAGDQGIVNKWIAADGIDVELLSPDYNLIKKDYTDEAGLAECRLLHFAGHKPWIGRQRNDGAAVALDPLERLWGGTAD
ncbi:hypothetical protein [Actomonas aquatica]|uniref:Glycosyl transferase n=1 Tax=Actomonas aquatica TaxID=2866162 RepID=A0ABZ1CE06_9BACT|nr:hypothetical protein [Opitutus sp. WL0086]WRQ89921.1 hypothetical protein K1X11_010930 [Opitutus sp. WL0086]